MDASVEALVLSDAGHKVSVHELVQLSGLTLADIQELVDLGVLETELRTSATLVFSAHCISLARTGNRLRRDFDLNATGVALALTYLERIHELEARLHTLECQQLALFRGD